MYHSDVSGERLWNNLCHGLIVWLRGHDEKRKELKAQS